MQFTRLRLRGFKSFVDPTELVLDRGLTGVVGPNGCGKSNLVEALRWVMGETSAKRMRGGEMDDVIFGGSQRRPAYNLAEVAIHLDNAGRDAPAPFNDLDELDIVRRIARDKGSTYRVNGREVRARDVQLLFADQATGAGATALVSQGRIGAIVNARPAERRHLLEEAAGIGGLHARRHEAELRLRAAASNLERLDDVLATLRDQHAALEKQVKQAQRYRRLSARIEEQDALLCHIDAEAAAAACAEARERLKAAEAEVAARTQESAAAATAQAEAQAALPALRESESAAAAALQRQNLAHQSLDQEAEQVARAQRDAEDRRQQIDADRSRAEQQAADADAAVARLDAERTRLEDEAEGEDTAIAAATQARDTAKAAARTAEQDLNARNEALAGDEARAKALARRRKDAEARRDTLTRARDQAEAERARLAGATDADAQRQDAAARAVADANAALAEAREDAARAAADLTAAREAEAAARDTDQGAEAERARLQAEIDALTDVLTPPETADSGGDAGQAPPILDTLWVAPGYETALGAALGADLDVPADPAAPAHWTDLAAATPGMVDAPPPLPKGAAPLRDQVSGAPILAWRLARIGVVPDRATGVRLHGDLVPGQRLVSPEGDLWRWDGYTAAADAPPPAAERLAQRNKRAALEARLPPVTARAAAAREAHTAASQRAAGAQATDAAARKALDTAYNAGERARKAQAEAEKAAGTARARLAALDERRAGLDADLDESARGLAQLAEEEATLPDLGAARAAVNEVRAALADRRRALSEAQGTLDRLHRAREARAQRMQAIAGERASWARQAESARAHLDDLDDRRAAVTAEHESLAERPAEIAARKDALAAEVRAAEARRREAADALAVGESRAGAADKALKAAEAHLAEARETRVRRQAAVEQAETAVRTLADRVAERFDCALHEMRAEAGLDPDTAPPPREAVQARLQRLTREREGMGPVNLRAEAEAEDLRTRIESMDAERADLTAAIDRLRQGIADLNREGRARLHSAFERVNGHFADLFRRLFGGGEAHLRLNQADDGDPLAAGLEIMASPPGKKLQVMSLLSGGEQALTALSLLFAVFLTNPAPICVLDEVDAPLDDANVDRFCTLLEELAGAGRTRFLVITHHRMTMSRMDRLFGVTMSERGVSQLVSVDLNTATDLRDSP